MNYSFTAQFQVNDCDADQLAARCGRVMDELVQLDATDPFVAGAMAHGEVEISLVVTADSYPAAVAEAMTLVRTAIHAAEGATPGWPHLGEGSLQRIEAAVETPAEAGTSLAV